MEQFKCYIIVKPYVDLLVQEYIKIDYDVSVIVVSNGEVIASMKRNVMSDDIRSNASLEVMFLKLSY